MELDLECEVVEQQAGRDADGDRMVKRRVQKYSGRLRDELFHLGNDKLEVTRGIFRSFIALPDVRAPPSAARRTPGSRPRPPGPPTTPYRR